MSGLILPIILVVAIVALVAAGVVIRDARRRGLDRWVFTYIRERSRYLPPLASQPVHVLLCIADHFEPGNGGVTRETARARMERWSEDYPLLCEQFRDSDGKPPRHTFFYPIDMYDEAEVDAIAHLCRLGLAEVEIHLHHDHDTAENLEATLLSFKTLLAGRHGLLARRRETGEPVYGFVHGNWALDNSRPDGRCCGVNNEIDILRESGCYADFTLPSAPSPTQTRKINSIYYAVDDPLKAKSHDWGTDVGHGTAQRDGLMMIQGPLILNWQRRKWGVLPSIENGCLQGNQPPSADRLDHWLRARIQIPSRPDWYFVKLHTHGGPESNHRVLLGEPMAAFHRLLARRASQQQNFFYHYVTAREMYNLALAAESGWRGTVADARDYHLVSSGVQRPRLPDSINLAGASRPSE